MRRFDLWEVNREKADVHESGLKIQYHNFEVSGKIRYGLRIWKPKGLKPFINYYFRSEEDREKYKNNEIENHKKGQEEKKIRKEARKVTPEKMDLIKVGDIFYDSWGYDQTNIDFFQVVEKKVKSVIIRGIAQTREATGFMCGQCMPVKDEFISEPVLKRVSFNNDDPSLPSRFGYCGKWDGRSLYFSNYA